MRIGPGLILQKSNSKKHAPMHLFIYFNLCFSILQSFFAITHWHLKKNTLFQRGRETNTTYGKLRLSLGNITADNVMKNNSKIDIENRFKSH